MLEYFAARGGSGGCAATGGQGERYGSLAEKSNDQHRATGTEKKGRIKHLRGTRSK